MKIRKNFYLTFIIYAKIYRGSFKEDLKMKIAVISDIHGNMQALEAVLESIKQENCEKIFCLGDLAMAGPEPSKMIDKIRVLL